MIDLYLTATSVEGTSIRVISLNAVPHAIKSCSPMFLDRSSKVDISLCYATRQSGPTTACRLEMTNSSTIIPIAFGSNFGTTEPTFLHPYVNLLLID